MISLQSEITRLQEWTGPRVSGRVTHVIGLLIESSGPHVSVGELCTIYGKKGEAIPCEVVGFKDRKVLLMALTGSGCIAPGCEVFPTEKMHRIPVSPALCGRILDGLGRPIDGKGDIVARTYAPVSAPPPHPLGRGRIDTVLPTGIKAIDGLLTLGRGQRMGIFSGAGVGKSTLMGMIAQLSRADINVIALIGERGREVREFIERDLGPEGLARSVVVVATADQAALLRSKGASVATAIAESFRDQGKHVILMMDSITRYAMAQREIGLAVGEPPTTKGYTPSVFAELPRLLERAGNGERGSITGIYTILAEGDDLSDPVADQTRALLDGHIVLSRTLAGAAHFPPIDVLDSVSRVMGHLVSKQHLARAARLRELLQAYRDGEELIHIGAYVSGSNPNIDRAIARIDPIRNFLKQGPEGSWGMEETLSELKKAIG